MKKNVLVVVGIAVLIALIVWVFTPNLPKRIWKKLRKQIIVEQGISQKKYDSLEAVRQTQYLKYIDDLEAKDRQILEIKNRYENEKLKRQIYQKELENYRNSNFDDKFDVFSNTIREN